MKTLEAPSRTAQADAVGAGTVLHAHYYDAALHRAITETGPVGGRATIERAAASAAYREMAGRMTPALSARDAIEGLILSTGLGVVEGFKGELQRFDITLNPSPFAKARHEMFGVAPAPACDVTRGVLSGALGAVLGKVYEVKEVECAAAGGKKCHFVAEVSPANFAPIDPFAWPMRGAAPAMDNGFPPPEMLSPLMKLEGGIAGATYGSMWAEMYARAAQEFEAEVPKVMGSKFTNLASVVLTEAAHLGTFYSIGGLIRSSEWRQLVVPRLPAREDWVHAIVSLVEAFGWGAWRVRLLAPEQRFTVHVHGGYEALSYHALSGVASTPRCYFARGVVAALMNILYAGDVITPAALDQSLYNRLFRSPSSFRAIETSCQAMGHEYCEFVANPLSPGMRRS